MCSIIYIISVEGNGSLQFVRSNKMVDFKNDFEMVGLSADWIYSTWRVEQKHITHEDTPQMQREIVVFEDEESDREYLILAVERTNDYEDIRTAIIYSSHNEDDINKYLTTYDLFYSDYRKQWVRTSISTQYTRDLQLDWE